MNVSTDTTTIYTIQISDKDPLFKKLSRYLNGAGEKPTVKSKGKLPKAAKRGRKTVKEIFCMQPGCTHAPFATPRGKQVHQARTGHHDPVE